MFCRFEMKIRLFKVLERVIKDLFNKIYELHYNVHKIIEIYNKT